MEVEMDSEIRELRRFTKQLLKRVEVMEKKAKNE